MRCWFPLVNNFLRLRSLLRIKIRPDPKCFAASGLGPWFFKLFKCLFKFHLRFTLWASSVYPMFSVTVPIQNYKLFHFPL